MPGIHCSKKILICGLLAVFFSTGEAQQQPVLQFVESIPAETILDNADIPNAPEAWAQMMQGAHSTMDIEQFYVSSQKGEALEAVIKDILDAAARGVKIRFIADKRMYRTYPELIDSLGKTPSIEMRLIDFGTIAKGIQHAKFFIVDGKDMFLGSQNFDWRALTQIHELGIRIRHTGIIDIYREVFDLDWALAAAGANASKAAVPHRSHRVPFRVFDGASDTVVFYPTYSPAGWIPDSALWDEPNMVRLVDNAQSEVCLQFLSYSPRGRGRETSLALDDAVRRAASRGVRIRLIVADWSKGTEAVNALKSLSTLPNVEVKFSSIPDLSGNYVPFGRVEHCKFIVADRKTFWLGTGNAERSYFYSSRNLGIIVSYKPLAERLTQIFMKSWTGPYTSPVRDGTEYPAREHGEKK